MACSPAGQAPRLADNAHAAAGLTRLPQEPPEPMHKTNELTKVSIWAAAGGALLGVWAPGAHAQRIEITGSSIRQLAAESALPVTVLRTDELAKAGVTNAEQAMSFITSNQSGVNTARSVSSMNGGAANADLRGLGAGRTLVLVNGKRLVANSYDSGEASAVDLNTIAYGAVERIEVLNDGASAIYGSDAVAGVVNFITRRDYQGLTLNGALSQPFASGGGQGYDLGATGGVGALAEQGWNLFGSIGYRWQKALPASARSYASTGHVPGRGLELLSPVTFPANYYQGAYTFNPSLPGCQPPSSLPVAGAGDPSCGFDYSAYADLVPKQTQLSALAKGSYALDRDNTLSLEYLRGQNELSTRIAPTSVFVQGLPPSSPFYPGGAGLAGVPGTPANTSPNFDPAKPLDYVDWRTTAAGRREVTVDSSADRWLLDWVGSHGGWDYSLALLQSTSKVRNSFDNGYVNSAGMNAGVTGVPLPGGQMAPWLNPFGAQTAAGAAFIGAQQITGVLQRSQGTLRGFKADASSPIARLPSGPLTMALGLEHYRDEVGIANDTARIGQASGSGLEGAIDSSGSRSWTGVFAEVNVPVLKELELNLALRYDDYSDFGSTTNPKASLRWTPSPELMFRGSYNTGFRAPSLYDVHAPGQTTYTYSISLSDPLLCPGGVVDTAAGGIYSRDCNTYFQQTLGGNRQLQPESSTAWSLGLVLQPDASWLLSVDYWNYAIDDSIGNIGEDAIFADPVKYANRIVRCSQLPASQQGNYSKCGAGSGDPIAYVDNTKANLGTYETSGIDMAASWRGQPGEFGRFFAGWQATYVLNYEYQLEPGGVFNNNLGTFFNGRPVSRYRQVLNLGWQRDEWLLNLVNRYSRGYIDQNAVGPQYANTVAAVNTWDLALSWNGLKNTLLTAGVTNLFDQDPPFSNQDVGPPSGYDYRFANPIGRAFLLRAVYTF